MSGRKNGLPPVDAGKEAQNQRAVDVSCDSSFVGVEGQSVKAALDWAGGGAVDAPRRGAPPPPSALPCLNSHNSTKPLSSSHRRTAFALTENVMHLASRFGLERLGFLTLTFRDHVTDIKEAQRRFNSLKTHVIGERFEASICVVERMKSGRIHFHLLVVLAHDIRTGFDFEAVKRNDYRSANNYLRDEWAAWRGKDGFAARYGFGRTELLPVKSTAEGIAKYVGKYIAKHIGERRPDDKGARLVRYTLSARQVGTNFAWVSPLAKQWRERVGELGSAVNAVEVTDISKALGSRWAHYLRGDICTSQISWESMADWRRILVYISVNHGGKVARKVRSRIGNDIVSYWPSSADEVSDDPGERLMAVDAMAVEIRRGLILSDGLS